MNATNDTTGLLRLTERTEPDETYETAAREALTRPRDYVRWITPDDGMFSTWGYAGIGVHRDSDAVDRSNYRSILRDLTELEAELYGANAAGEWLSDERASHWAVGWVDSIVVRILFDEDAGATIDNLTPLFIAAVNIATTLHEQYPIWDEEDFSAEEHAEYHEVWTNCVWPDFLRPFDDRDNVYLDWLDLDELCIEIADWTSESDPTTWRDDEIMMGVVRMVEAYAYDQLAGSEGDVR